MNSLRRLILFKNGLGCFERHIVADQEVHLDFRASEIDDVIKSVIVYDEGVKNLSFDGKRPSSEDLADIGLRPVQGTNALIELLVQFTGVPFRVVTASSEHKGILTGIDERQESAGESVLSVSYMVLLAEDGALQSVRLSDVIRIIPDEERAGKDLKRLLEASLYWKATERKKLVVQSAGGELRLSYMLPVPVWTSSYRLLLREADACMMQAWALVHNASDEDWEDLQLSLASGMPMSFRMDLYTPRHRQRPFAELPDKEEYAAPVVGRSYAEPPAPAPQAKRSRAAMAPAAASAGAAPFEADMLYEREEMAFARASDSFTESTAVEAQASEFAPVSFFKIREAVHIPAGKSSLVPLFTMPIEGRRVALYRASIRKNNPMAAVLLRNTTGFALEDGPITFYSPEGYMGEGMLPAFDQDEQVIVPFAIEGSMLVNTEQKSETKEVHRLYARGGLLFLERKVVRRTVYLLRRGGLLAFDTLYIDHPESPGWTVVGRSPESRSEGYVRFCTSAEADEFDVIEEYLLTETLQMQVGSDWLDTVLATGLIQSEQRSLLDGIARLNHQIDEATRREGQKMSDIEEIGIDQERIRENLKALGSAEEEKALRRRYVAELEQGENRLRSLKEELNEIRKTRESLITQRGERMDSLSFDFFVDGSR
jgi:hypothetical protein